MCDPKKTALDYLNNWRNAQEKISQLEAEVAELREALTEIVAVEDYGLAPASDCRNIARAALLEVK